MKPTPQCVSRLTKEYRQLLKDPIPGIYAFPQKNNLLILHYLLDGPTGTPLEGGKFYGTIRFSPSYPFEPPGFYLETPSGTFSSGSVCLSMSNYHPESWVSTWTAPTLLLAVQSFFYDKYRSDIILLLGKPLEEHKKMLSIYARSSIAWNLDCHACIHDFPGAENLLVQHIKKQYMMQYPDKCNNNVKTLTHVEETTTATTTTATTTPAPSSPSSPIALEEGPGAPIAQEENGNTCMLPQTSSPLLSSPSLSYTPTTIISTIPTKQQILTKADLTPDELVYIASLYKALPLHDKYQSWLLHPRVLGFFLPVVIAFLFWAGSSLTTMFTPEP